MTLDLQETEALRLHALVVGRMNDIEKEIEDASSPETRETLRHENRKLYDLHKKLTQKDD